MNIIYTDHCVMCGAEQVSTEPPPAGAKCLCPRCFEKVRTEFEARHPGQGITIELAKGETLKDKMH